jgi:hypothetical protein
MGVHNPELPVALYFPLTQPEHFPLTSSNPGLQRQSGTVVPPATKHALRW